MSQRMVMVRGLGKAYRIGRARQAGDTAIGRIAAIARRPLENFSRLRSLSSIDPAADDPSILWALRDVSFDVADGEVLGILGGNGAGKSTLLKILSRITTPTAGRAELHGKVSSLLEVGTGFHPELTGRENIFMNGTILGMSSREVRSKFDEIVDFSGVEKFIETPVKWYSSGMRMRLAFSVAAHLDAEIVVVDEVLAVGDASFQKKCLAKLDSVRDAGRTVLFVSHNMTAVRRLCSRAIQLEEGRVVADGPVNEVLNNYLGTESLVAERSWAADAAPSGEEVKVLHVAALNSSGKPAAVHEVDAAITIAVELMSLDDRARPSARVALINEEGAYVFVTLDHSTKEVAGFRRGERYRKTCEIPGNLLNEGRYSVIITIDHFQTQSRDVLIPNALFFEVLDRRDGSSVVGEYFPRRLPGAVRPLLAWSTESLGAGD